LPKISACAQCCAARWAGRVPLTDRSARSRLCCRSRCRKLGLRSLLEWSAFGRCTETAIKIDSASDDWNARRRELPSILLYNYGFFVRAEADPHRFERFALIRRGQVECVIPNDGIVYRAHPSVAVEDN